APARPSPPRATGQQPMPRTPDNPLHCPSRSAAASRAANSQYTAPRPNQFVPVQYPEANQSSIRPNRYCRPSAYPLTNLLLATPYPLIRFPHPLSAITSPSSDTPALQGSSPVRTAFQSKAASVHAQS